MQHEGRATSDSGDENHGQRHDAADEERARPLPWRRGRWRHARKTPRRHIARWYRRQRCPIVGAIDRRRGRSVRGPVSRRIYGRAIGGILARLGARRYRRRIHRIGLHGIAIAWVRVRAWYLVHRGGYLGWQLERLAATRAPGGSHGLDAEAAARTHHVIASSGDAGRRMPLTCESRAAHAPASSIPDAASGMNAGLRDAFPSTMFGREYAATGRRERGRRSRATWGEVGGIHVAPRSPRTTVRGQTRGRHSTT